MRSVGFILVMLGLAGGGYLVAQNLEMVKGERDGKAVVEPMEAARETAGKVQDSLDTLQKQLDGLDK